MNIIESIRVSLGRYFLRKLSNRLQRNRVAMNLNQAREIGIIFSMHSEEEYTTVGNFARELQLQGKKVHVVGFCRSKNAPAYYAPKLAYDLLLNADVDIFYRPKPRFAEQFIEHPFDLLFDLSHTADFPLVYMAELSVAGFKIGRGKSGSKVPYDLQIESNEEMPTRELINQMVHYTGSINFV